jgi:hypothetical protein
LQHDERGMRCTICCNRRTDNESIFVGLNIFLSTNPTKPTLFRNSAVFLSLDFPCHVSWSFVCLNFQCHMSLSFCV